MRLKDTKNTVIYIIEVGVLTDLNKYSSFRNSYKKLHDEGILEDENVAFTQDLNKAKRYIEKYVRNGTQGTYGVLSIGKLESDSTVERNGLLYDKDNFEENELFSVERDLNTNRMNLYFDGIPDAEVRSIIKSNGFRWSPNFKCWTRQLTDQAEMSLKRIKRQLEIID